MEIILVLSGVLIFSIFMNVNMYRKLKSVQLLNSWYESLYNDIILRINIIEKKINEIDNLQHFEADDEVGFFFEELKYILSVLLEFKNNMKKTLTPDQMERFMNSIDQLEIDNKIENK